MKTGGSRGRLNHAGDRTNEVASFDHSHSGSRAVGHAPGDRWVKRAILAGNDRVAGLLMPGGDGQFGAEGSAQYWDLRARHEFGRHKRRASSSHR
jgi:hypothetical protein